MNGGFGQGSAGGNGGFPVWSTTGAPPAAPYSTQLLSQPGFYPPQPAWEQVPMNQHTYPAPQVTAPMHRFIVLPDSIRTADTNQVILTITRKRQSEWSFSSKPTVTITRPYTNTVLASITIHSSLSNDVDLLMNGREIVLKAGGTLHERWKLDSRMAPAGSFWWFDEGGDFVLKDAKKNGNIVASMNGHDLIIVMPGDQALVDEVIVSAVAMAEARKQRKKEGEEAETVAEVLGGLS